MRFRQTTLERVLLGDNFKILLDSLGESIKPSQAELMTMIRVHPETYVSRKGYIKPYEYSYVGNESKWLFSSNDKDTIVYVAMNRKGKNGDSK